MPQYLVSRHYVSDGKNIVDAIQLLFSGTQGEMEIFNPPEYLTTVDGNDKLSAQEVPGSITEFTSVTVYGRETGYVKVPVSVYLVDAASAQEAAEAASFSATSDQSHLSQNAIMWGDITVFTQNTGNEDMPTQTVIDTAAVSNALSNGLTLDSMAAVVTALATAANNADVANKTELQNMITALQPQIDAAMAAADKLENYELGQVEAILQELVSSDGFQTLLQTATVTVDGEAMTLESVLASLLEAPKVASWDFQRDTHGNISGVLANLTDGSIANMSVDKVTVDSGLPTEFDRYTFSQSDWAGKGFAAQFEIDLISRDIDFGGLFGLGAMGFGVDIKKQGNLLFDITGAAAGDAPEVTVPDANNDGVIGNTSGGGSYAV
ncbi:hypothetical protein VSS37_03425 [Candidatus Thiothrix sp. Deng01]|uniref:Uncharacterized protein n=1 Tax=Candidatus Thiothrix phosphatis TaxID=3112415 RepID=A0ABU6CT63_9GAMM|nr:hypothetical protein [Candidatus Thiothrix sp. Deng01]MEB4590021.1 hypothetical protein [Candidatus Thiothrix sp. Deng01]